jgi:uncharacterized protein
MQSLEVTPRPFTIRRARGNRGFCAMAESSGSTCLCSQCSALCCRYFALPIDNPDCAADYDNIRWYLCHENVTVFVEKAQWYIGIANRCKQLQADNRCGIYETRPKICRKYSTENCDYHGGEYDFEHLFTSADQLDRYAKKTLAEESAKKKRKAKARPRPDLKKLSEALTRQLLPVTVNGNGNGRRMALPLMNNAVSSV